MAAKRAKSAPNEVGALSRIQAMAQQPKQSPLEQFVLNHFEAIAALHTQGYTVPDICAALKQDGYVASPASLHAALRKAALTLSQVNPFQKAELLSKSADVKIEPNKTSSNKFKVIDDDQL